MKPINLIFLFLVFLSSSCSSDESNSSTNSTAQFKDLIVIHQDLRSYSSEIIMLEVKENGLVVTEENLTQSLSVPPNFRSLKLNSESVTFHRLEVYSNKIYYKNFIDQSTTSYIITCGTNIYNTYYDKEKLFTFTARNEDSNLIYDLNYYNPVNDSCETMELGSNYSNLSALVHDNYLLVRLRNGFSESDYEFLKINLNDLTIADRLSINSHHYATIKDNSLLIFYGTTQLKLYDLNSFELLETRNGNYSFFERDIFFEGRFKDNLMLTKINYPQPGLLLDGPMIMDLKTGNMVKGQGNFMYDVRNQIIEETGVDHNIRSYTTDLDNNYIVIGFNVGLIPEEQTGLLVYTNFEGEIFKTVEIDYSPTYISFR